QAFPQQLLSFNRFWLRLVRQGNTIIGYTSANGSTWILAMQVNVSMAGCVQVGLVATNSNPGSGFSATFGNVDVSGLMLRPGGFDGFDTTDKIQTEMLSMYPNPGSDIISLRWAEVPNSEWEIVVTDAVGRIIMRED